MLGEVEGKEERNTGRGGRMARARGRETGRNSEDQRLRRPLGDHFVLGQGSLLWKP